MDLVEEEEEEIRKKKTKKKERKEVIIPLEEEEEEIDDRKSKRKKDKKSKERKEIQELIEAQIDEGEEKEEEDIEITESMANTMFKFIYENARNKPNQTIGMDQLWNTIKGKKECKEKKINNSTIFKNVCLRLEDEGKIFVSENEEITLV